MEVIIFLFQYKNFAIHGKQIGVSVVHEILFGGEPNTPVGLRRRANCLSHCKQRESFVAVESRRGSGKLRLKATKVICPFYGIRYEPWSEIRKSKSQFCQTIFDVK